MLLYFVFYIVLNQLQKSETKLIEHLNSLEKEGIEFDERIDECERFETELLIDVKDNFVKKSLKQFLKNQKNNE
ncbi:hypothetical protein [Acidithiobacillus sp.]|jgi:hypothetical protein|uniref:hypothetical protein n=1 Tax=Acidithiobacillus sp. TaxID=1872118 RepID=UPI0035694D2F